MADTNTYTSKQNIKKYTTQAKFDAIDKSDVPVGTEYNIVGPIAESDLDSDLQAKVNLAGTAKSTADEALTKATQAQTAANGKQDKLVSGTNVKTINGQSVVGSGNVPGVLRVATDNTLILQFMGDGGNTVPYGFYAPTTSSIGGITPPDPPLFEEFMGTDIVVFTDVYLYERVTETDTSKLIKNETPLILTRGDDGLSGSVLMKAPALNDTDTDVYFMMNVSWADGGTMLAQINGLKLDLRTTNNENGEFVGHIIIPSAKWAEGIITFMSESLLVSGLDYRELPAVFANQNSFYVFRQIWETGGFQGIEILRADTIDGTYSPVSQDNMSINIVPYSI